MAEKKSNKGLVWLIVVLMILVLGLVGYILYDKVLKDNKVLTNDNNEVNTLENDDSDKKENKNNILSDSELQDLAIFINEFENYAFSLANYSNPKELLIDNKDDNSNIRLLSYSIKSAESMEPTSDELNIIWSGEAQIETNVTTPSNIEYFLETKTKYDFGESDIKNNFHYVEEIDKVAFMISDTIFGKTIHIVDGYKKNDKVYLTLDNDRELVLMFEEVNGYMHYYFYSCLSK